MRLRRLPANGWTMQRVAGPDGRQIDVILGAGGAGPFSGGDLTALAQCGICLKEQVDLATNCVVAGDDLAIVTSFPWLSDYMKVHVKQLLKWESPWRDRRSGVSYLGGFSNLQGQISWAKGPTHTFMGWSGPGSIQEAHRDSDLRSGPPAVDARLASLIGASPSRRGVPERE